MSRSKDRVIPVLKGTRICPKCDLTKEIEAFKGVFGYYVANCAQCRNNKKFLNISS